jgi:hypothetical protein
MGLCAWEANSCLAPQHIRSILLKQKGHFGVQNSVQMISVPSQMNPVQTPILFLRDLYCHVMECDCRRGLGW